jgi:microcompartment protein CcmL/EutN
MSNYNALGLIEVFGLVFVLEAADAMIKAAEVELIGYENTASGYISVLVNGDVSACNAAVQAGVKAVEAMGAEVYSSVVIARPHPDLKKITDRYTLDKLLPSYDAAAAGTAAAGTAAGTAAAGTAAAGSAAPEHKSVETTEAKAAPETGAETTGAEPERKDPGRNEKK